MRVQELIEKRAKVWETAKNFVDTHEDKNGNLSAEDKETYSRMEAEIEELTNSIERQQRAERREQELSKPVNSPITGKPYKDEPQGEVKTGRASDEYKKAMLTALRSNFRQVSNVLQEGVDADGGYLVPEEYDHRLIDVLTEENIMRGIATKITTSGEHKINIAATKPAAAWIEEGEALSFGDATFEQKILDAHKLHVAIKITEELLYDNAFGLENYIITEFGKALANAEEDAFLNGDGVGKPTGIFDKTKGGESIGTLTAALKSDDVLDLIYKLKRPYRKNAWVMRVTLRLQWCRSHSVWMYSKNSWMITRYLWRMQMWRLLILHSCLNLTGISRKSVMSFTSVLQAVLPLNPKQMRMKSKYRQRHFHLRQHRLQTVL